MKRTCCYVHAPYTCSIHPLLVNVILRYLSHVVFHTIRQADPRPHSPPIICYQYLLTPPQTLFPLLWWKKSPTVISKPWRASNVSLSLDGFTASLRIFIYLFIFNTKLKGISHTESNVATLVLFSDSRSPYEEDLDREDFMSKSQVSNNYRPGLYIFWQNTNRFVLQQS